MLKVANSVISASRITGVLPVVNGGTGVTTSTGTGNTVLSATPTLSGDVTLSTGNLVIGTAGKGIDFSVTSSGSGTMTSELLADYEEGTFTPDQGTGLTVVGAFSSVGRYTKVGRLVTVHFSVSGATSVSAIVGDVITSTLPFSTTGVSPIGAASNAAPSASTNVLAFITSVYPAATIAATTQILVTITYITT